MKRNGRGQAAMEYLTTYGWAILIIVIVLAALLWMGVFNVINKVPDSCSLQAGFSCLDAKIIYAAGEVDNPDTNLMLKIRNNLNTRITFCRFVCNGAETFEHIITVPWLMVTVQECIAGAQWNSPNTLGVGKEAYISSPYPCVYNPAWTEDDSTILKVGEYYRGPLFVTYFKEGDDPDGIVRVMEGTLVGQVQP